MNLTRQSTGRQKRGAFGSLRWRSGAGYLSVRRDMKKPLFVGSAVMVFLAASASVIWLWPTSYSSSAVNDGDCVKSFVSAQKLAISLSEQGECHLTSGGSFKGEAFFRVTCPERANTFIFGGEKACHAFKELGAADAIKVMLRTLLPPNQSRKADGF